MIALVLVALTVDIDTEAPVPGTRLWWRVHLATTAATAAALLPLLGWTVALPDNYSTAVVLTVITGSFALIAHIVASVRIWQAATSIGHRKREHA